jgi:hypothetical protein
VVRALLSLSLSVAFVVGTVGIAFATDHTVEGTTQKEFHQLIPILDVALCDPSAGDPSDPLDIDNICRYAIRGKYTDSSTEAYLGTGRVNGRFTFNTTSFDAPLGEFGCFHPSSGVVKFTNTSGDRIRFKLHAADSTVCQVWDGSTSGPDGVRTEPTRTIHWEMKTTASGCVGIYCGNTGSLVWDSTATFDTDLPDLFRYKDAATFSGVVTSP